MTEAAEVILQGETEPTYLTSEEDRQNALRKAASESSFLNDVLSETLSLSITILLILFLYVINEQAWLKDYDIFGFLIVIAFIVVIVLRMLRNIRGFMAVMTYKRVASRTNSLYIRTHNNCPFLQQLPFNFICVPRPLAKFPEKLLFRCHVKTEWIACQKEIIPELITNMKEAENALIRARASWGLGIIGSKDATTSLIEGLTDFDLNVKMACIWSLGKIKDERATDPLIRELGQKKPDIRSQASKSLISIGSPACSKLVEEGNAFLDDLDILCVIMDILGKIGCPEAIPFLVERLEDEDDLIQLHAAYSLGDTRHQDAVKPLLERTESKDTFLYEAVLDSLARLGHHTLIELPECVDARQNADFAREIIYRMEETYDQHISQLEKMGKTDEVAKLEQLFQPSNSTDAVED